MRWIAASQAAMVHKTTLSKLRWTAVDHFKAVGNPEHDRQNRLSWFIAASGGCSPGGRGARGGTGRSSKGSVGGLPIGYMVGPRTSSLSSSGARFSHSPGPSRDWLSRTAPFTTGADAAGPKAASCGGSMGEDPPCCVVSARRRLEAKPSVSSSRRSRWNWEVSRRGESQKCGGPTVPCRRRSSAGG